MKKYLSLNVIAVALSLLSVSCRAQGTADLDATTQQIEAKLAAETSVSYHYEISHPEGGHYDYGTNQSYPMKLISVPGECNMGKVLNFKVVKDVRVLSAIEAFAEGKEGRDGWIPTIRPNYYKILIEASSGTRHLELDLRDRRNADETAALIRHAVDLCGQDKILTGAATAPKAANITLEQTIGFINDSYVKEGAFDYSDGTEEGVHVRYVAVVESVHYRMNVISQTAVMQGTSLTYTLKAVRKAFDETPVLDKKGSVAKGHDIVEFSGDKARISEKPADKQVTIELATAKRLQVRVQVNEVRNFHGSFGGDDGWKTEDTTPSTYLVQMIVPPPDVRTNATTETIGIFFDEDHANRAAKAYAHAVELLQVSRQPSVF